MIKENRAGTLKKPYETIMEESIFSKSTSSFTEKEDYIFNMASTKNSEVFSKQPLKTKALCSALIPVLFVLIYKIVVSGG